MRLASIALVTALVVAGAASAHEIRPALLDITEHPGGTVEVVWKVPTRGGEGLAIEPVLPAALQRIGAPAEREVPGARISRSRYVADEGALVGGVVEIAGLSAVQTDVLLRVGLADGTQHSAVVRPSAPRYRIPAVAGKAEVARSYWRMGVVHILGGVDHLLFLAALLLIVSGFWKLLQTVTAFTVAHSVTLALATLGFVHVPPAPTEAVIALSILFLAAEIVRKSTLR